MSDRLYVTDGPDEFRLQWWIEEDGDEGGYVGDCEMDGPAPTDPEEWRSWMAYQVAKKSKGVRRDSFDGFVWESKKMAASVLGSIKLAWKQARPLADWEEKALAAGWKPPKSFNGKPAGAA